MVLFAIYGFCYLADDDQPTPKWVGSLEWQLISNRTKGQDIGLRGDVYLDQGDCDRAILEFNKSLRYYPEEGANRFSLGMALYKRGRPAAACIQWQKMDEQDEEYASEDVREDLLMQSRKMLRHCHQVPASDVPTPHTPGYDF